jgi:8-oxo-dGTP pyrophosphatase MutT (NUDIX family)
VVPEGGKSFVSTDMKYGKQVSAGGVLYRPSSGGGYEVALIRPRGKDVYALPKGLVEEGEDPARAALREVEEETGMRGEVVDSQGYVKYYYYSKEEDTRYFKLVHFYLMRWRGGSGDDHDWEVEGVEWVPLDRAADLLSYRTEREIVRKAAEKLLGHGQGD